MMNLMIEKSFCEMYDLAWSLSHEEIVRIDKKYVWHPFTQMSKWTSNDFDPLVLVSGEGSMLRDSKGNTYIDGNASIWTNIHGHNHPTINKALFAQANRVWHTSFLGATHPAAAVLAQKIVGLLPHALCKVFYSDNGSTANEVSIRMAAQYRILRGENKNRHRCVAFDMAYHGDTLGASLLGGIDLFRSGLPSADMGIERISNMNQLDELGAEFAKTVSFAIIEPLVRGPSGMRPWPDGMLRELRQWCDKYGVLLILDEVMTGFGRTGTMFAFEQENIIPDFLNIAKGITGGALPMAATITTQEIFDTFLGGPDKTFYYGHSYTANPMACAAALASLQVFEDENVIAGLPDKIATLEVCLKDGKGFDRVVDVRNRGLASAIEFRGKGPISNRLEEAGDLGDAICNGARKYGLLTRPIRNSVVFLPPLCITKEQIAKAISAIYLASEDVCGV